MKHAKRARKITWVAMILLVLIVALTIIFFAPFFRWVGNLPTHSGDQLNIVLGALSAVGLAIAGLITIVSMARRSISVRQERKLESQSQDRAPTMLPTGRRM